MKPLTKLFKGKPQLKKNSPLDSLCSDCTLRFKCETGKMINGKRTLITGATSKANNHKIVKHCYAYVKSNCGNCTNGKPMPSNKWRPELKDYVQCGLKNKQCDPNSVCGHHLV